MNARALGFIVTVAAVLALVASLVLGVGGAPEVTVEPPAIDRSVPGVGTERIRVEVLNAAGIAGLARRVTEDLRAQGFDVVYYGNAGSMARDSTTILDRTGNEVAVAVLAAALGIDRVEVAIDTTLYLEATVVLAPDWRAR